MGYTTDFEGSFKLDRALAPEHAAYLKAFNETRRMRRDPAQCGADPVRIAAGLPIGDEGAYFVGGEGFKGQERDRSVLDYNQPPTSQPGLWCQWVPTDDGTGIEWDGGEKFYDYVDWLEYLIVSFLKPWGYVLNGRVTWQGEQDDDVGTIVVVDNNVDTEEGETDSEGDRITALENRVAALEAKLGS